MRPIWKEPDACYVTTYQPLRGLVLMRARLAVSAAGMTGLQIRNDQSVLDARKPFEPFGVWPSLPVTTRPLSWERPVSQPSPVYWQSPSNPKLAEC